MKKLLCCFLLLWVIMTFAGCGEKPPVSTEPTFPAVSSAPDISPILATDDASCAVVIGSYKLNAVGFGYYFDDAIMAFYNDGNFYNINADQVLDPAKPLNEQMYKEAEDITWADYFLEQAFKNAKRDLVLYGLAQKEGWTLSQTSEEELDTWVKNLEETAVQYAYPDGDSFLEANYGPGYDTGNYRAYLRLRCIAEEYYTDHLESLTYDDATLRAYEQDKYDQYTSYTYDSVYLSFTYFPGDQAAARAAMEEAANTLASARTPEELEEKMQEVTVKDGASLRVSHSQNTLLSEMTAFRALTDWLTAPDRKPGDTAAIADTNPDGQQYGYYIVFFKSKNENKERMGNVRHLLVKFEDNTDASRVAAREKAEGCLNTWKTGAATEESFVELVKAHSQDSYLENGGLYENIHPGSNYVKSFEEWAIDPARQPGETGIIESEYGYHVMYYVGLSPMTYRDYMITNELADADQKCWYEQALEAVSTEVQNTAALPMDMIISPE